MVLLAGHPGQKEEYLQHMNRAMISVGSRMHSTETNEKESPLRPKAKILLYLFNVDRLVDLAIFAASEDMRQTRIKDADMAFIQAHTLACKMLGPVHPLTIQITLHRALMLYEVAHRLEAAWDAADSVYRDCEQKLDRRNETQVAMLHMLRTYRAYLDRKMEEAEGGNGEVGLKTLSRISDIQGSKTSRSRTGSKGTGMPKRVAAMRDLFQAASTVPLVVEGLAHAPELERGLRAIFKCYVKGNFAPAETRAGEMVKLNGRPISLGDYLLEGPYMRWDGFLSLCHDFHICARSDSHGTRDSNFRPSEDFLLSRESDLAAIFASASADAAGGRQVLATSDFLRRRAEAAGNGGQLLHRDSVTNASPFSPDKELWDRVAAVATGVIGLGASDGLNYDQFIDCLARCGLVGYSLNSQFNYSEMYPTNHEKVQALLCTHMSLLDTRHYQHIIRTHALSSSSFDMRDLAALYAPESAR